ncbi:ABC transporter substrate-binding protein [Arthrobacter sp. FW306-04-A]|uniref:ABC transporter substrate-binding protein n=1 Tax=Arthrobacter sp. FW306-04-A TaxID=2879619 RepID=UPI0037BFEC46|nr:ABC transporter substrate-binding protein [Arthrobacter sp. FW306-04-A]
MKNNRALATVGVFVAGTLMFTACSGQSPTGIKDASSDFGLKPTGLPIVDKTLTLRFSGTKAPLSPAYESMPLVQQWAKDTNIDVKWENLPDNVYKEKKNLILASGDLPDAFFNTGFSDTDISTYGTNGTLVPLEDLIDKYAPNLAKILKDRPDIKAAVTSSDGHIYSLPNVEELGLRAYPNFMSINKAWLDKLGLPVPQTIQEYHDALVAFKTKDPNGNGKNDEIPLSFINNWWCADISDLFAALGGLPDNIDHRIVQNGKVIFTAAQDQYKTAVSELHKWYQEGLIDPESFSQDDKAYLAKGKSAAETLGSYVWWETEEAVGAGRAKDYVVMPVLKGKDGKQIASVANGPDISRGAFAITRADKYPAATMRWVDGLYDPTMSAQTSWGPIGAALQKDDKGVLQQIPAPAGTTAGERRQKVAPGGPHIVTAEDFQSVVAPEPRAAARQQTIKDVFKPHAGNDQYPNVLLSNDELQQLSTIETDVQTLVKEKRAKWIVSGGVDQEWDSYVAQLKSIGLDKMVKIYQDAYNRYKKNS